MRALLLGGLLLLSACAARAPLPAQMPTLGLPLQLHLQRTQAELSDDSLLVIQQEGPALRWSQLDLIGMPLARLRLQDSQWQTDGFLAPNPAARELFAALLFALTPSSELPTLYPNAQATVQGRSLGSRWAVRYRQPMDFTLELGQGLRYQVSPLPSEASPP
nr:hypothetical protein [Pseudomonas sp. RIT-PI-S]